MSLRAAVASAFAVGMNAAQVHNGSAVAPRTMSGRGRDRSAPVWMDLSTMQDIGGCRAVLNTQEQVQRVVERFCANSLKRNQRPDKIRDYVAGPHASGYRAIHIYTRYHGRRIEVQLRTREQDRWAKIVEDLTSKTGIDVKNGDGPDEVHELLRKLSELLSQREPGQPYTEALMDILTRLSMTAAFGLIIRPRQQGTGEE